MCARTPSSLRDAEGSSGVAPLQNRGLLVPTTEGRPRHRSEKMGPVEDRAHLAE